MRRATLFAIALAAAMPAGKPAVAWLLYPDRDDPQRWIVEIEKPYGDVVSLRFLPVAISDAARPAAGRQPVIFYWRYDRQAEGRAFFIREESGPSSLQFEFLARQPIDGQRLGAAAVLVAIDGAPLHVFFALTGPMNGSFENGAQRQNIRLSLDRPPEWWRNVEIIVFFTMRYYPQQELDDEEAWAAMRRAVGNYTQGRGTEQRE